MNPKEKPGHARRFDEEGNTRPTGSNYITHDHSDDGLDRRGFLRCMAWAGTATVWAMSGGVPTSVPIGRIPFLSEAEKKSIFFAQISDSHIGFNKEANQDVAGTLREAVAKLNALPHSPAFVLHTGDITQLAKAEEFDTANEILKEVRTDRVLYVPGEHDVAGDNGAAYLRRYGKATRGNGWYSFDHQGVHFVGLVNVMDLKAGGLGTLGTEQLAWLERDVRRLPSSTPIVLFAHVPLWTVYPDWGWGTDDAEAALSLVRRFGSVTVLNGHIHQIMQKVEGNISFHTALSTAFPQPAPGTAAGPGPLKVMPERLRSMLGVTDVTFVPGRGSLAIVDGTLSGEAPAVGSGAVAAGGMKRAAARGPNEIGIDNFQFTPPALSVAKGTRVTWVNDDDVPHIIASAKGQFTPSPLLDTAQRFSYTFDAVGTYPYYCSLHPKMQGTVTVT